MSGTLHNFRGWMSELPEIATKVPLSWLAIPGNIIVFDLINFVSRSPRKKNSAIILMHL